MATFPTLHQQNWKPALEQAITDTVDERIDARVASILSDASSSSADAAAALILGGSHPGLTISRNVATGNLDIRPTNPLLVLAAGAPVPAGTAVGTIIVRS